MYEECPADLRMTRVVLQEGLFDETAHHCKVIRYNPEEECIYLMVGKSDITAFSLDGIYECTIASEDGPKWCSGVIRERYLCKIGKVLVFRIQNGFYKNNLNKIKVC